MRIDQAALDTAFGMIARAAATGAPCPSNGELADRVGAGSLATAVRLVRQLETRGLIRVTRFTCGREVMVVGTGQRTAPVPGGRPHFSLTRKKSPPRPRPAMPARPPAPAPVVARPRVERDPCWRCGVRADVGCAHQPATAAPAERLT